MLAHLRGRSKSIKSSENAQVDVKQSKTRRSLKLSAYERGVVPAMLEPYRYIADSERDWHSATLWLQPCLQIRIVSHSEAKGHTYYHFECSLSMSSKLPPYLAWSGMRRLQHLRKGLHDVSKRELGSSYKKHFKDAPFARRGGIRGTTKRLNTWCSRLADCINGRIVPPVVVAQTLKLLDVRRLSDSSPHDELKDAKLLVECESFASASTTDTASNCSSYESDFESESASDVSDSDIESIAEDLPFPEDNLDDDGDGDDDVQLAPYEPSSDLIGGALGDSQSEEEWF